MVETIFAPVIALVIFDLIPLLSLVGILAWVLAPTPELDDHDEWDLDLALIRLKDEVAELDAYFAFDSFSLLLEDLDDLGIELSHVSVHPVTGEPLVIVEEDSSIDVDLSEFSDAVNPASVQAMMILSVGDKEKDSADLRDGRYFGDTVVDVADDDTCILVEDAEVDVAKMVSDILSDAGSYLDPSSDEYTFFVPMIDDTFVERASTVVLEEAYYA